MQTTKEFPQLIGHSRAHDPEEPPLLSVLQQVAELAARAVPGADGVGLSLLLDEGLHGRGVATKSFVHVLDAHQNALGEGPSLLAVETASIQHSTHLGSDARWPTFGPDAARIGVQSALSLPLVDAGGVRGTVDVYAHRPEAFTSLSVTIATAFASSAAVAVSTSRALERSQRLIFQLNEMMCDRQDIDRAVGILMGRAQCTPTAALEELHACAVDYGRSLQESSHALVARAIESAH